MSSSLFKQYLNYSIHPFINNANQGFNNLRLKQKSSTLDSHDN